MRKAPIILMTGITWTGKTTVAEKLIKELWYNYRLLSTLELRKEAEDCTSTPSVLTDIVWSKIHQLDNDEGLIIEWVWKTPERRIEIWEHSLKNNRDILVIHTKASIEDILQRVTSRQEFPSWTADTNQKEIAMDYIENYIEPSIGEQSEENSWLININTSNNWFEVLQISENIKKLLWKYKW